VKKTPYFAMQGLAKAMIETTVFMPGMLSHAGFTAGAPFVN
jgi:hypothetical protein